MIKIGRLEITYVNYSIGDRLKSFCLYALWLKIENFPEYSSVIIALLGQGVIIQFNKKHGR